jgi:hypothetical protein
MTLPWINQLAHDRAEIERLSKALDQSFRRHNRAADMALVRAENLFENFKELIDEIGQSPIMVGLYGSLFKLDLEKLVEQFHELRGLTVQTLDVMREINAKPVNEPRPLTPQEQAVQEAVQRIAVVEASA